MTTNISVEEVKRLASDAAFGKPLISNMYRGLIAEVLVNSVLSNTWRWCGEDWNAWDFEHQQDGCRLEVKQSAALQTWSSGKPSKCSFGVGASKGFYTGDVYTEQPGRKASIYIFAHHPIFSNETDHRDPLQWRFYVLKEADLPKSTQTISLPMLIAVADRAWENIDPAWPVPCILSSLATTVELIHRLLERPPTSNSPAMLPTDG